MARARATTTGRSRVSPWVGWGLLILAFLGVFSTAYMRSLFLSDDQAMKEVEEEAFSTTTQELLEPVAHIDTLYAEEEGGNSADDGDATVDMEAVVNEMMDGELDETPSGKVDEETIVEDADEKKEEETGEEEEISEEEKPNEEMPKNADIVPPKEFDIAKLVDSIRMAELYFESELEIMYGSKYAAILFHKNETSSVMNYGEHGQERLRRRLQIKILSNYFDESSSKDFLWVTGGHSAAAGHGNLHQQSYTKVMEKFASDVFASAGLNLVTRNYAMGGYPGVMELSLCFEQIFGKHVDVFAWDYGMIDGRNRFHLTLFLHRVATMAKKWSASQSYFPFFLLSGGDAGRKEIIKQFEGFGMAAGVIQPTHVLDPLKDALPDAATMNVTMQEELPQSLQFFRCKNDFEKGDPCTQHKYDTAPCPKVKGQVHWHPGWKMHQVEGLLRARAMTTAVWEAIQGFNIEFHAYKEKNAKTEGLRRRLDEHSLEMEFGKYYLNQLIQEETADRDSAFASVTNVTTLQYKNPWTNADMVERITTDVLARGDAICHTALLPSQARYRGIVTESGKVADLDEDYDKATPKVKFLHEDKHEKLHLPLVREDFREECNVTVIVDFKDVFFVQSGVGWVSTKLPNDAEVTEYRAESETFNTTRQGIILICPRICPFNKCAKDLLSMAQAMSVASNSILQMEVDGVPVHNFTRPVYNGGCAALRKEDGSIHWPPTNERQQYDVRMRVDPANQNQTTHQHFQVSSFILL